MDLCISDKNRTRNIVSMPYVYFILHIFNMVHKYLVLNHIIISGNCMNNDLKPKVVHLRKNDVIAVCLSFWHLTLKNTL